MCPLHCVGFLQPQWQADLALGYWLSEEHRPHAELAGSLPPAPVIEDGCQNKAGGMNWHDEVRK